jgi:hypothetical protein
MPQVPLGLQIDRRMSSPADYPGSYAFHPHYGHDIYTAMASGQRVHPAPSGLAHMYDNNRPDNKPPRFRPTKEQLAILIASYDKNK